MRTQAGNVLRVFAAAITSQLTTVVVRRLAAPAPSLGLKSSFGGCDRLDLNDQTWAGETGDFDHIVI
jgi:hypothetical protein